MLSHPSVFERILQGYGNALSPEVAKFILALGFSSQDKARCEALLSRAQESSLNAEEQSELDDLVTANDVLMLLKSKARSALKSHSSSAA